MSSTRRRVLARKRKVVDAAPEPSVSMQLDVLTTSGTSTKLKETKLKMKPNSRNILAVKVKVESHYGPRPNPQECYYVTEALSQLHPHIVEENNKRRKALLIGKHRLHKSTDTKDQINKTPITDQIIGTMLSQNTTDANCHKAFATLKREFPNWDQVATCEDISLIENSIKVAGLAKTRAQRIQSMLQSIKQERGDANFEYLQDYESNDEIVKELKRFKGMGPKTISCVLLFALGRNDFPVDTHVLRITQQMGWVAATATRESAYEHFKNTVPGDCMMDLHCLLVQHGKVCYRCAANGRPQFPPGCAKAEWKCPLVGIKSGETKISTCKKPNFTIENEGVTVKEEAGVSIKNESDAATVTEKTASDIKEESNDFTTSNLESNFVGSRVRPDEIISGIAINIEHNM